MSITQPRGSVETTTDPSRIQDVEYTAKHWWRRWGPWVITAINLSCFFLLWELIARAELINRLLLPRASDMFIALWEGLTESAPVGSVFSGSIRDHLIYSMTNLGIGMAIAIGIGVPLGLLMGANKWVDTILSPYVWAISSMPRIALVPLLILVMGFTRQMKLTIIVLSAVFPIMINSWAGVKTTDKSLLAAAKVSGAKRWQLYTKVVFPFTLPFIISGIQQGVGRGLVGLIIAEVFGGSDGLGYLIQRAADTFDSPLLFAVLFVLVIVSLSLVQITRWLEARIAPWRKIEAL